MMRFTSTLGSAGMLLVYLGLSGCGNTTPPVPSSKADDQVAHADQPSKGGEPPKDQAPAAAARLEIRPAKLTAEEWKHVLAELPEVFRIGLKGSDEENAQALGLRSWAFSYEGGPLQCWFEIQETGQKTFESRIPGPGTSYASDKEKGRILLWLQPRSAKEMLPEVRKRLEKEPKQVPDYFLQLDIGGERRLQMALYPGFAQPKIPLWYGWAMADVKVLSDLTALKAGESGTALVIEATEKGTAKPRTVKFALKAMRP
jgi:hypothetical protein